MVLLTALAMHSAGSRSSRHVPASPADPGLSLAPEFPHTNGFFYSPSHSEESPSHSKRQSGVQKRNGDPFLNNADCVTSPFGSSMTSQGLYSSLTNLDSWSPSTVSASSLLRHSYAPPHGAAHQTTSSSNVLVPGDGTGSKSRPPLSSSDPHSLSYSACTGLGIDKAKSYVRRTVSADPHNIKDKDLYYPSSRPLGAPHQPDPGNLPRVCSADDLNESEYVTLDYAYRALNCGQDSQLDNVRSEPKDIAMNSPRSSNYKDYKHYFIDENNYFYVNGHGSGSSGYCSLGSSSRHSGSGSTGSLQRSGLFPVSGSAKGKSLSTERLWQPRTGSPLERGRGSVPRKKGGHQTLQTVAENIVQAVNPGKSILKNSSSINSNSSNNGSGSNTPRSNTSSCRSSITSRQDSCSIVSSDLAASEPCSSSSRQSSSHPAHTQIPTTLHSLLVKYNHLKHLNLSHTFGGLPSSGSTSGSKHGLDEEHPHRLRLRSKSLSDLRMAPDVDSPSVSACYSDDEDGDDFGFLSYPFHGVGTSVFRPRTAMHKGKAASGTSSPSHRLLPRRWRNKNKGSSSGSTHPGQVMWSPEGPCTWYSVSGRKVILKPESILRLSDAERLALQKLASSKLQTMDLTCPIVIPKDANDLRRQKKRALSLKRRSKSANLASLLDTLSSDKGKDKENKDSKPAGMVFGIPLSRCISNDRELAKRKAKTPSTPLNPRNDSSDQLLSPRRGRKSSSSSQGSVDNGAHNGNVSTNPSALNDSARRAASSDSLSESDHSSRNTSSSLIDALSLQASSSANRAGSQAVGSTLQVPHIVDACFKHLETYGLQVLGIFRVGSSKKRVKQLRDEFDSGKDVRLTEDHNPHDVGALLKEFFRDLPEPLLTRDLYLPFVATRKIKDRENQTEALRLLLTLLPPANRDTLWTLLRFLASVNRHSSDSMDSTGREVPGNKMDSHNLATLFGPNILHRARAVNEKQFMAECAEQAEQSSEVIGVVKDMIDNHYELFEISAEQRDQVLKLMMEADHENLDKVLRRLSNENQIEPDPESMCSVFEAESDASQSLPHTANSDADLLHLLGPKRSTGSHQPLRASRSADPWTDPPQRAKPVVNRRVSSLDSAAERLSQSPSPQDSPSGPFSPKTSSLPRPPMVTISQENPEVVLRSTSARRRGQDPASGAIPRPLSTHLTGRERPYSESTYTGSLNIPKPAYMRENSGASSASCSSYLSSSGGHASDSSGHWVLPTPPVSRGTSPQIQRRATSQQCPPSQQQRGSSQWGMQTSSSRSDDDDGSSPAVGSPEWQRERWRHWEEITAGRNVGAGDAEQETLV